MTDRYPWHVFDAERGLDVRRDQSGWQQRDRDGTTTPLSDAEFDRLRSQSGIEESAAASNPNPGEITDAMWRFWTESEQVIPGVRLGGIYADKPGYHNTVNANQANWPGNYSIQLDLDLAGPQTKARALDLTMSDARMREHTGYLRHAALDDVDDRLRSMREFYGTLDSSNVYGLIKDSEYGTWRSSSADDSHLWHIHISIFTTFVDNWDALAPIVSVLSGESYDDWKRGGSDLINLREGDDGQQVKGLQGCLQVSGFDPGKVDGFYGPKTSAAVLAMRKARGSSVESGDWITGWAYTQLMMSVAIAYGGGEPT